MNDAEHDIQNIEEQDAIQQLNPIDKTIYRLFEQGLNQTQIAEKMKYTKQEISRRIIKRKNARIKFIKKKTQ